jgi:hypothetical protein
MNSVSWGRRLPGKSRHERPDRPGTLGADGLKVIGGFAGPGPASRQTGQLAGGRLSRDIGAVSSGDGERSSAYHAGLV